MTVTTGASGSLEGQVAIVTGAARGIGAAIAVALARAGADVAILDVSVGLETAASIESAGKRALPLAVDVSDRSALRHAVATVIDDFGRLDVLVNNAGIVSTARIDGLQDDEWDQVLAINLTAAFVATQASWTALKQSKGRIVYVGSRAARTGGNNAGAAYVTSKAGIQALAISVALEGAPFGIRANAVMPGPIKTPMTNLPSYADESTVTPLGRMGRPEDIAQAVVYLVSPMSEFVTATALNVTGGLLPG